MDDKANERKSLPFSILHDRLKQGKGFVLIESAIAEMRIGPSAQLELPTLADCGHVDTGRRQSPEMVVAPFQDRLCGRPFHRIRARSL